MQEDQSIASGLRFVQWRHVSPNIDARKDEEIPCRDVHLARCLQFAMHKFCLSLFVKDLEPGGSTTFCFLIV